MKRCPYCGQEYSDECAVCAIDQNPLESCDPKPPLPPPNRAAGSEEPTPPPPGSVDFSWQAVAASYDRPTDTKVPAGFGYLGRFEPFDAEHLLNKFAAAGVRFQINNIEKRVFRLGGLVSGAGYVTYNAIDIFVCKDDEEKAAKIYTADWKV